MRNSAELEFGQKGSSLLQLNHPQDQLAPPPPWGFRIDPSLGAIAKRAPATSREVYRSEAILKFYHPISLD